MAAILLYLVTDQQRSICLSAFIMSGKLRYRNNINIVMTQAYCSFRTWPRVALLLGLARAVAFAQTSGAPDVDPAGVLTQSSASFSDVQVMRAPIGLHPHIRITSEGAVGEGGAFILQVDGNLNNPDAIQIFAPGSESTLDPRSNLKLHITAIHNSRHTTLGKSWFFRRFSTNRATGGCGPKPVRFLKIRCGQ
jgi:hypothetical protein